MMRAICLALLLAGPLAADIADDIKASLAPFSVLKGEFQQSKSIKIIKKPLKSSGRFTLLKDKGVLWNALKPMPGLLKVTQNEITQIKDGKPAFSLKSEEQPALRLVGKVLFAVFSADLAGLKKHFEISGKLDGGRWKATLKPKEAWMARVAREITIEGAKTVDAIGIAESNGDQTMIQFKKVNLKAALTPAEKALFD